MSGIKLSRVFVNIDSPDIRAKVYEQELSENKDRAGTTQLLNSTIASHTTLDRKVIHTDFKKWDCPDHGQSIAKIRIATLSALIPTITNYTKVIKDAGLAIEGMVPSGYAQSLGLLKHTERDRRNIVLIDFGAGSTKVTLFKDALVKAVVFLPTGAQNITDDIAAKLKVSSEDAEQLKIRYRYTNYRQAQMMPKIIIRDKTTRRVVDPCQLYKIVTSKTDYLLQQIKKVLLELVAEGERTSKVVVSGGGSVLEGFLERAEEALALPIKMGFLYAVNDRHIQTHSALYATNIGLIRYGLRKMNEGGKLFSKIKMKTFKRALGRAEELYHEYF